MFISKNIKRFLFVSVVLTCCLFLQISTKGQIARNEIVSTERLSHNVEEINQSEISKEKEALLSSAVCGNQSQKPKTIAMLEKTASESDNPALWVNLGRLYQLENSYDRAEKTYTKAIELAKAAQEPVEQILAKAGLAEMLDAQGKKEDAATLLKEVETEVNALKAQDQLQNRADCNPTCTRENYNCGACCKIVSGTRRIGKCTRIYGTPWIVCQVAVC